MQKHELNCSKKLRVFAHFCDLCQVGFYDGPQVQFQVYCSAIFCLWWSMVLHERCRRKLETGKKIAISLQKDVSEPIGLADGRSKTWRRRVSSNVSFRSPNFAQWWVVAYWNRKNRHFRFWSTFGEEISGNRISTIEHGRPSFWRSKRQSFNCMFQVSVQVIRIGAGSIPGFSRFILKVCFGVKIAKFFLFQKEHNLLTNGILINFSCLTQSVRQTRTVGLSYGTTLRISLLWSKDTKAEMIYSQNSPLLGPARPE